jgi:hypothetical protein
MADYRLYQVNGEGHIAGAEWIEAETDDEAINEALSRHSSSPLELWQHERLIAKIPACRSR